MGESFTTRTVPFPTVIPGRQIHRPLQDTDVNDSLNSEMWDDEDDYGIDLHYEKAFLANLKGCLAETKTSISINVSNEITPGAADTSDSSLSGSDCDLSVEEPRVTKVKFSNVAIRTYSLTVGDTHVAKAYPISLDWAYTQTETLDIDLFEELFCSAQTKSQRRMVRGFRLPARLRSGQRFRRLEAVTGRTPEDLYELEFARMVRDNDIPIGACSSDAGYEEDQCRQNPYEVVDMDDYQMVDV